MIGRVSETEADCEPMNRDCGLNKLRSLPDPTLIIDTDNGCKGRASWALYRFGRSRESPDPGALASP
jgi:hypothetical protein